MTEYELLGAAVEWSYFYRQSAGEHGYRTGRHSRMAWNSEMSYYRKGMVEYTFVFSSVKATRR